MASPVAVTPGAAIAARRRALGVTVEDVGRLTNGVMNQKLLSRLENNHAKIQDLRVNKLAALLSALHWRVDDLETAAGLELNLGALPQPGASPSASAGPSDDRRARLDLERSADIGISKMRDELRRMDEHLRVLETEVKRLRVR